MAGRKIARRGFLLGAAAAALTGPFLRIGSGSAERFPKRFVVFYTPNGFLPEHWLPRGADDAYRFRRGSILEPLQDYRDYLVPLSGIKVESAHHGPVARSPKSHGNAMMHMLTAAELPEGDYCSGGSACASGRRAGVGGGISVDERIADHVGSATPLRILHLGVGPRHDDLAKYTLSYRGPEQPVADERDPRAAFARVFGPGGERQLARRMSVVDHALADLSRLEAQLGASERLRLQAHVASMRELERELESSRNAPACAAPELPEAVDLGPRFMNETSRMQIDILVRALACDRTRVGTLMYNAAQGKVFYSWLSGMDGRNHHQLGHDADDVDAAAQHVAISRWYSEQFRHLLDGLSSVPEGDGTLLDNTLVFWCTEHGEPTHHEVAHMNYLLAGRAGGALQTGRYLRFDQDPHSNLLLSLCHAMDLEIPSFGTPEWCTGPLSGLL